MKSSVLCRYRGVAAGAILLGLLTVGGCRRYPFSIVPVSGKVTYTDGTPIPGPNVKITFVSQSSPVGKAHPRNAFGIVQADGTFECLTTEMFGDGAIMGPHKVLVESTEKRNRPTGAVPPRYRDAALTPLTAEVTADHGPYEFLVERK